ncbi:MAG: cytochrome C biogenesis protein [bacterium]|nr:cytochrome C biogenesis protein [bacterium]
MTDLFSQLAHAVSGAPGPALAAAFVWGILSILLSPCHLASLPLIVAFIGGQGRIGSRRALGLATLFAGGTLVSIAIIGLATAMAGRMLGDVGKWGNWFVAAIFFVVGLHLLDIIPNPWSGPGEVKMKRRGPLAALLLGLIFGIALGPCTFAFMAPVLAVTFGMSASSPAWGALLLTAYGLGHSSVIILAGAFAENVQRYLDWNERSRGAVIMRKVCGLLVIAGGLYLLYIAA